MAGEASNRLQLSRIFAGVLISALVVPALALLTSPCAMAQIEPAKATPLITDAVYTHTQQLVKIDTGRRLNLYCLGSGSPTVVFDSGVTDDTSVWGLVQPVIAQATRTCSYDRAGVGFSDAGRRAGSS